MNNYFNIISHGGKIVGTDLAPPTRITDDDSIATDPKSKDKTFKQEDESDKRVRTLR